ncbi:MAG: winged helix-turn-helix transcriptional regulator [Nitrosopumilaceae archaeon]
MMSGDNNGKNYDSDLSVKAEEYLEIISTEDERIKIIGEELANDTGRAIFGKISQGIVSPNDLAKALNISLPLINWHINRLLSVGLVKVEKIELSSKNKQMKYYGPVKTALVIIPPEEPVNNGNNSNPRRESVLLKLRQYMASFVALAVSAPIIYTMQKSMNSDTNPDVIPPETADGPQMMMKSTESIESARSAAPPLGYGGGIPETSIFATEPIMILIALAGGAAIFLGGFLITRFYLKRKKNAIVRQQN